MAIADLTGAPERANTTPATLPPAAQAALARLEQAFAPTLATLGETSEEEHEKAKEPLPRRPRGPHPYPQGVTV